MTASFLEFVSEADWKA